ncbi:Small-conductance mechanosensitive channel [Stieleria maiorica]|uniref:Small-conductance mechanosensitive channel n=1 Tax=Stieleria maiorica TaxID=2795974 RepID=A0A5B9MJM9_9BACT|nr:mechanosensitive ion channel domain-containing protein [Stieleria maiorica]QEG00227.1 Small-conductance mechanosensitive channel [Stieleria maiorica]
MFYLANRVCARSQPLTGRLAAAILFTFYSTGVVAQNPVPTAEEVAAEVTGDTSTQNVEVAKEVQVDPVTSDQQIAERLSEIMAATNWFDSPAVKVDQGVVFLSGTADTLKHQQWIESTAINTSDVVAVVNRVKVAERPLWNFSPAIESVKQLSREATSVLPLIIVAIFIGIVAYFAARLAARATRYVSRRRIESGLLRQVGGNAVGVLVFLIGLYLALRVSGLTRLAVTLLGGTGLVGLALGFAFRDIAENYLASILLSLNHPFRVGDLIEVEGTLGYVRKVTTRGTVLNTMEGNQVQLPNSTVYKGKIINYTATPLVRKDFSVGIGFDDSVVEAQAILMGVLREHIAVVEDPAPVVVVESLGSATVNLRAYYWMDQQQHSVFKVTSSVIRQAKQHLTEAKITMPDEARELVFPQGVPVQLDRTRTNQAEREAVGAASSGPPRLMSVENEPEVSVGEGELTSEQAEVMRATANDETVADEANLIE